MKNWSWIRKINHYHSKSFRRIYYGNIFNRLLVLIHSFVVIKIIQVLSDVFELLRSPLHLAIFSNRNDFLEKLVKFCDYEARVQHLGAMYRDLLILEHAFLDESIKLVDHSIDCNAGLPTRTLADGRMGLNRLMDVSTEQFLLHFLNRLCDIHVFFADLAQQSLPLLWLEIQVPFI